MMKMTGCSLALAFQIACVVNAQQTIVVDSRVTCPTCRIDLVKVVSIGGSDTPNWSQSGIHRLFRDAQGRFYIFPTAKATIAMFDQHGHFLREVGRVGRGPGELMGVSQLQFIGDSLFVFDYGHGLQVLSSSFELVRSMKYENMTGHPLLRLSNNRFIVTDPNFVTKEPESRIYLLDSHGGVARTFGPDSMDEGASQITPFYRRWRTLGPGSDGTFWSAHQMQYRIDRWDTAGKRVLTITRQPDWFPPWGAFHEPRPDVWPPDPELIAAFEDSPGLLWVVGTVKDRAFKPTKQLTEKQLIWERGSALPALPSSLDPYLDAIVDMIDVKSGKLLATSRFPQGLRYVGEGLFFSRREDENGELYIDVWKLAFTRK